MGEYAYNLAACSVCIPVRVLDYRTLPLAMARFWISIIHRQTNLYRPASRETQIGAGWENRTPVLSLENLYISRYTNPADPNRGDYNTDHTFG